MFSFDLSLNHPGLPFDGGLPLLIAFIAAFVLWMVGLVRVLTRKDFDPITRLTWVVVIVTLNIVGVILYALVNPFCPRLGSAHLEDSENDS